MWEQPEFEDSIVGATDAIRRGDPDGTMHALADLASLGEDALRAAAMRLARTGAGLIGTLFPDQRGSTTASSSPLYGTPIVELRLTDVDGSGVQIDDLEPTLRSAIRMVLCIVNGSEDGAREQLDLVCATSDDPDHRVGLASVVIQLLMWTAQMQGDTIPTEWQSR
jgi:hypothetical protein